jgi:hypothetical protein
MPFSTDDPNAQELLARNASFDAPAIPTRQSIGNHDVTLPTSVPQQPNPLPPPDTSRPGGIRKFFANVLAGMSDAAMKEATGMNFAERKLAELEAQQKQQQVQFGPIEAQAKIQALSQQPRFNPSNGQFLGVMNDAQYQQYLRGLGAAQTNAQSRKETTDATNQTKMNIAQLQATLAANKGSKYVPDVDPQTGQQFYRVLNPYGQEIGRTDVNVIPQLMTRTSSTTEYRDDGNGNIIALPKSTTSGPNIPGRKPPAGVGSVAPAAGPRVVAKGKPVGMVVGTDSEGRQVAGTPSELQSAGVQQYVKLGSAEADKVNTARQLTSTGGLFDLVEKDLAKFKPGELDPLNSRLQEFLTGKWGSGDPRYVALRTHLNGLLGTAMMQAHVGSRGGERIMEHFEDIAKAGKMDADTIKAALAAEKQYVEEKAMRPTVGNTPPPGAKVRDFSTMIK